MTEAATLVGASRVPALGGTLARSTRKPVLLDYLENSRYYIPGTSRVRSDARRIGSRLPRLDRAVGNGRRARLLAAGPPLCLFPCPLVGWALVGFFFGWVGLVLMLVLRNGRRASPARLPKLRLVTRDTCEHCGGLHAAPASGRHGDLRIGRRCGHITLTAR